VSPAIGPYRPLVRAGPWLVCSGQLGIGPDEPPALVPGGTVDQLVQALHNADRLLQTEGAGLSHVVKTTIYLLDMADYGAVNEAYAASFDGAYPARTVVAVAGLPMAARVEVECWAYLPPGGAPDPGLAG